MNIKDLFASQEPNADEIMAVTKHYSEATAIRAMQRLQDTENTERTKLVIAAVMTGEENITKELLALEAQCPEATAPNDHNLHHLIGIIRGLHEHEQYKNTPLDLATGTEFSKVTALMNITSLLLRDYKNPPLIIENPDNHKTSKIWLKPEAANLVLKYHEGVPYLIDHIAEESNSILQGLQHLNWWKKQSISTIDDKTINTLFSYLYVTATIREHAYEELVSGEGYVIETEYINDPVLEDFIENNPAELEAFMIYIKERGNTETGAFQEWKNNGTALRAGAL